MELRWERWGEVMAQLEQLPARRGKGWRLLVQLVPGGVPEPLRGTLWQELSGATADAAAAAAYARLLGQRSAADEQIRKDMPRTLPQHDLFRERSGRGQASLFNVVRAYALHDPEVGYCQGIANVAATLLLVNSMDEQSAFATLTRLMAAPPYALRQQYVPGMPMLGCRLWQLERLLATHRPRLAAHLARLGVLPTTFASEWFLTLFAYNWPTAWVARVWDLFLVHGAVAIFATALAICAVAESECAAAAAGGWDFERTVGLLRHGIASRCADGGSTAEHLLTTSAALISAIGGQKALAKLEREYNQQQQLAQQQAPAGAGAGASGGDGAEDVPVFVRRRRAERELRQAEQRKRELLRHNAALRAELAEAQATLPVVRAQVVELRKKLAAQEAVGCAGTDDGLRALSATTEQMADGARDRLEAVTLGEASSAVAVGVEVTALPSQRLAPPTPPRPPRP